MATAATINVKEHGTFASLNGFFKSILELEEISALLIPVRLHHKNNIMPMLVTDVAALENAEPLAPAFPINAAIQVSKLTRKPVGGKIAVVLRPCEIRAFVELVKLNQADTKELVILGIDCPGAFDNASYREFVKGHENPVDATKAFVEQTIFKQSRPSDWPEIATACKSCIHPTPDGADIAVELFGSDADTPIPVRALTEAGEAVIRNLDFPDAAEANDRRKTAVASIIKERKAFRDQMITETRKATDSLEKLTAYFSDCVNCYNCRAACPVCYCRECVFLTDTFAHEPFQYLQWATRKGAVKLPADTLFFHLTRLSHMSLACVGCGQCSNACPNDIPVMELFAAVALKTQNAFEYEAGKDVKDNPPLTQFKEDELEEIVGIDG